MMPPHQPSRALYVTALPAEVTYEDICDAVGAFGNLESVKMVNVSAKKPPTESEKRQAFINFVHHESAYQLMMTLGQYVVLHGKPLPLQWAKTKALTRDLMHAIRNGATRNLYVANVPESMTDASLCAMFGSFGELESVRLVPKKRAAFVNFVNITAAMKAKEAMHGKPTAPPERLA